MNLSINGRPSVALVSSDGALVDWNSEFEAELGGAEALLTAGVDYMTLVEAALGGAAGAVTRAGFGESRTYRYTRGAQEVEVRESKTGRGCIFRVAVAMLNLRLGSEGRRDDVLAVRQRREVGSAMGGENGALSRFAAKVNRELRTPMQGVLGMASLLLRTKLNSTQRAYLGAIDTSGRILLRLINDIVAVSELGDGSQSLRVAAVDLVDLIEGVVALLAARAGDRGLSLQVGLEPTVPRMIRGDALRLRQVLLNIMSRAIKLTTHGSIGVRVSVTAAAGLESEPLLRFEIEGGADIEAERAAPLDGRSGEDDGEGDGLAVSRSLVERMGGNLGVISESRLGSILWFELPNPQMAEAKMKTTMKTTTITNTDALALEGLKILIVEDNEVNLVVIEAFILSAGGVCDLARNGAAAVNACAKRTYDVVLMDIHMPGMDGLTASQIIRAARDPVASPLKIIAITADARPEVQVQAADVGMDWWIAKPFDRDELVVAISRALDCGPLREADARP